VIKKSKIKRKIKSKRETKDSGFEEYKRLRKMWENRGELSKKNPEDLEWREHQMLSQKIFEEGNVIEAFVVLHGLIEIELNELWQFFMIANGIFEEEKVEPKPRPYSLLTELLFEAGLIEKSTHQELTDFNAHRNLLSHNLYGFKKKRTTKRETEKNFEKGLGAAGLLPIIKLRYLHVEGKKNRKFKKALKEVFGFSI